MTPHSMAPLHAATAGQHAAIAPKPPAPKNSSSASASGSTLPVPPQGAAACRRDTRRAFLHGLVIAAAGAGASLLGAVDAASAASKRRPPAPAPSEEDKKDPNVSGVLAKVMASRKRKEAMKEAVAKLREKGKPVATQ